MNPSWLPGAAFDPLAFWSAPAGSPPGPPHGRSGGAQEAHSPRRAFLSTQPFPTFFFPAAWGQIWEMGEGGEHSKLVVMFIRMPERLGLCTYPEGPEQSRRGEKEGIRGDVL